MTSEKVQGSVEPKEDPYAGQGGTYLIDPKTGERTLVERTEEPKPAEE